MSALKPQSPEELAETLKSSAQASKTINILGRNSKRFMAGPILAADTTVSTTSLDKLLAYERDDLTISVEAGMRFSALQNFLRRERQMIALDPPFSDEATVGGVVASNVSGPMRRSYGTARDMVIGMTFATLEGKLIKTGGMVVKNVAGLDMGKMMIGSFGTLAAITSVNFKLTPIPEQSAAFVLQFSNLDDAIEGRDQILKSVLQPASLDLLNPKASDVMGMDGWCLIVQVCGNAKVIER